LSIYDSDLSLKKWIREGLLEPHIQQVMYYMFSAFQRMIFY
jgi:hypothetical protein